MKRLILTLAAVFTLAACETPTTVTVERDRPVRRGVVVTNEVDPYFYPEPTVGFRRDVIVRHRYDTRRVYHAHRIHRDRDHDGD